MSTTPVTIQQEYSKIFLILSTEDWMLFHPMRMSSTQPSHHTRKPYSFDLKYDPPSQIQQKRCRKRKITYFNPPYSQNIQSNIGEQFFKALDKCFPQNHVLRKVINRNTVKLSYRCMPNIQRKISTHNAKVLQTETGLEEEVPLCNCRDFPCPLDGNCRSTKSVVYKASVLDENGNKETYTGLTKNTFEERYYGQ